MYFLKNWSRSSKVRKAKTEIKQLSSAEAKVVEIEDGVVQLERLARGKNVIMYGLEDSDDEN